MMTARDAIEDMCYDCVSYPCYALKHDDMCMQKKIALEAVLNQSPKEPTIILDDKQASIVMIKCGKCGAGLRPLQEFCDCCGQLNNWEGIA